MRRSEDWGLDQYSEQEKLAALNYLVAEGFLTFYQGDNEEWFVKIADTV